MATKLKVRLPPYVTPRTEWRRCLHAAITEAMKKSGVKSTPRDSTPRDRLSLEVRLYLNALALKFHDVDNRLTDIMDALQGKVGGNGPHAPLLKPLIPNDNQVFRATIEKSLPPGQSHGLGHLIIRKL